MVLPRALYLQHAEGGSLGPLEPRALEALFEVQVIHGQTAVSADGLRFLPLRELPGALEHLESFRERRARGEHAFTPTETSRSAEHNAPKSGGFKPPAAEFVSGSVIHSMMQRAARRENGHFKLRSSQGETVASYRDGKLVAVETTDPDLALDTYLTSQQVASPEALKSANTLAPSFGGDLGAALIASGAVPPHIYFEKLLGWATKVVAAAVALESAPILFEPKEVPAPAVPLGFDRYGVLIEAVRSGMPLARLQGLLLPKRPCPVIISYVDGVRIEECKLQPRELRVLNAVDGKKTLHELLEAFGAGDDGQLAVLRAIYFADRAGFIAFGEDPSVKLDALESAELTKLLEKLAGKNAFEILGVTERSTNEEVRARYTDFAKKYHPDKTRQGASAALLEQRRQAFALFNEAFEAVETEEKRLRLRDDLEQGRLPKEDETQKVQETLAAETLFKKAEILVRVKKYDEALQLLDEALRLRSKDIEFRITRAFVLYLKATRNAPSEIAAEEAIRDILELMNEDANIAVGFLYLGHLNKAVNKPKTAIKYYERLLEYEPNNVEALREIRIANIRKEKAAPKKKWL